MLSDRYQKILRILNNYWAASVWGTPFYWDNHKQKLTIVHLQHKFLFSLSIFVIYAPFIVLRSLAQTLKLEPADPSSYYFLSCISVLALAASVVLSLPFLKAREIVLLYNQLTCFFKRVQRDFMSTFDPNTCLVNMMVDAFIFLSGVNFFILGFLIHLHSIVFSTWPMYMTSLVPAEKLPTWVFVVHSTAFFCMLQMIHANISVLISLLLGHLIILKRFLKECILGDRRRRGQIADESFRSLQNLRKIYRQLQLLQGSIVNGMSYILLPLKGIISVAIAFCIYSLVRRRSQMDITTIMILSLWAGGLGLTIFILLKYLASFEVITRSVLHSMRKRMGGESRGKKEMSRFLKSCKPLTIHYGRMYVVRKACPINFLKITTVFTGKALISFK
ncbi:unnamed protein product [Orchesella dallaii]|uniref:Odorant receptor n=1 Tax=Orchesella dallaii TaxID=48710 RepID=A0ABP1RIW7_9HEXA